MSVFVVVEFLDGKDTIVGSLHVEEATSWGNGDVRCLAVFIALRIKTGRCIGADLVGNG